MARMLANAERNIQHNKLKAQYAEFVKEWNATHSISKAPSFTSWKQNYR